MSTATETTMPAAAVVDLDALRARPVCTSAPVRRPGARPERVEEGQAVDELAAAQARITALEQQIADLTDRNRELASDLDDALDQLAGHALHAEQERLVRPPANAIAAALWEDYER